MTTPPAPPTIDATRHGDALVLRITNPARANALDESMLRTLASLLNGPRAAAAHVVLLAGAGDRHFSSGIDLGAGEPADLVAHLRAGEELLFAASEAIVACPRPVIAVLNGATMGGGFELAMACDWRIASRDARIGMPAARLGVVYSPAGLRRAVHLMGPARVRRLFLTGRPVGAAEAYELGAVDQLVDAGGLWDAAYAAAEDVAAGSPLAIAGTRAVIRALGDGGPADEMGDAWRERAFGGADLAEGLAAFRERRPARFELDVTDD